METEASNPWNKCGAEVQCTSRGNCEHVEYKQNVLAGITICTVETITQAALVNQMQKASDSLGITDWLKEQRDKLAKLDQTRFDLGETLSNMDKDMREGGKNFRTLWKNIVGPD